MLVGSKFIQIEIWFTVVDLVRERLARGIFQDWATEDVADLVRLMRKSAGALELGTRA